MDSNNNKWNIFSSFWIIAVIITITMTSSKIKLISGELSEQLECPEDCDCHYYRINWVTDCSESNLTTIPFEGLDKNVYILNVNGNYLKEVPSFPEGIMVRTLQLADNILTTIKNNTFANLLYMVEIDLSGNNITYIDPNAFLNNAGLITLETQSNPLDVVEGPFLISKSLLYLYLSDCTLSKLSPQFFANTTSLNTLDLSGNPLRILEPGIFDPLTSLETLKLNGCNLTHISGVAFNNLAHLKNLELSENGLKSQVDWPLILGNLARLEMINLRKSGISNLPDNVFGKNQWLRSLILAENELTDLDVATTLGHDLLHLDTLDLSYCHLEEALSGDAFTNATKLRTLILSGNPLSASDLSAALAPLSKLQILSLKDCKLTKLPANTFHRFPALQKLDISYNPLNKAFTSLLSPLQNLEYLDMGYSNLKTIARDTFLEMDSLKTLILSGNKLDRLDSGLFQNLTHLETLELNYCGLSRLNEKVFYDNYTYPDLEELRLAGNPLKLLDNDPLLPKQLTRLKILDIRNCNITHISKDAFNSSRNITKLLLGDNKLSNLDDLEFLKPLQHLTHLDLTNNNLSIITPKVFENNVELSTLKLVGNPWKCDCNVVNIWQWALSEKGDIGMLIGSTTAAADSVAFGSKKKKALLCYLDTKTTPIKEGKLRKPGRELLNNVNRTWARYIREADCTWNHGWKPPRILSRHARDVSVVERMVVNDEEFFIKNDYDNIFIFTATTTFIIFIFIALYKQKNIYNFIKKHI